MKIITASDSTATLAYEVIYFVVKEGIAANVPAAWRSWGSTVSIKAGNGKTKKKN
jgi:hypothetical protein